MYAIIWLWFRTDTCFHHSPCNEEHTISANETAFSVFPLKCQEILDRWKHSFFHIATSSREFWNLWLAKKIEMFFRYKNNMKCIWIRLKIVYSFRVIKIAQKNYVTAFLICVIRSICRVQFSKINRMFLLNWFTKKHRQNNNEQFLCLSPIFLVKITTFC